MADLAEIMAQLKETRGYIYILSLPGVPEIVKIIGRKEGLTDSLTALRQSSQPLRNAQTSLPHSTSDSHQNIPA